ncbi:MAG: PDZ domain-containing protein [Pyrinomonadaceae bacterium]
MYRKLFALSLFLVIGTVAISAQNTPQTERGYRAMLLPSFSGSYLGVQTVDVTKENYSRFGLSDVRGVAVDKVIKNSPAEKAGLQNGDVIISFDGVSVTSVRKLTRLIGEVAPDHKVNVTVLRNGSERDIEVTVGKSEMNFDAGGFFGGGNLELLENMPTLPRTPRVPSPPFQSSGNEGNVFIWGTGANRQIGVTVTTLSKQLADYFGIADGKGLLINDVRADSPAAKAGLKAGDVIVEIDGKKIEKNFDLIKVVNEKKEGLVSITVIRDKSRQTFSLEPQKPDTKDLVTPDENKDN